MPARPPAGPAQSFHRSALDSRARTPVQKLNDIVSTRHVEIAHLLKVGSEWMGEERRAILVREQEMLLDLLAQFGEEVLRCSASGRVASVEQFVRSHYDAHVLQISRLSDQAQHSANSNFIERLANILGKLED